MTKKRKTKTEQPSTSRLEEAYTVVWEGFAPTKPFPTEKLLKYENPFKNNPNITVHYSRSKGIFHYNLSPNECRRLCENENQRAVETLVDSPETGENFDEKSKRSRLGVVTRSKSKTLNVWSF